MARRDDNLQARLERDLADLCNHPQNFKITLLFEAGELRVNIYFHASPAHGLLLGFLSRQIARDDVT